jgi:hypothetical protein
MVKPLSGTLSQEIGKPNNIKFFGSKTTKGSKQDSQNLMEVI